MKKDIHPTWYPEAQVICSCGATYTMGATKSEIRTDVCSSCHPFFTGEQRIVDSEGQVERFMRRLERREELLEEDEESANKKATSSPEASGRRNCGRKGRERSC